MEDNAAVPPPPAMRAFFRLTGPIVWSCLLRRRLLVVALVLASVLLGVVPTLKAEIESGVIDQLSRCLDKSQEQLDVLRGQPGASRARCRPTATLERFVERRRPADEGIPEKIIRFLFTGISTVTAMLAFLGIAALSAAIQWLSYGVSARIEAELFATLRNAAMQKGLRADSYQIEAATNAAGQIATAIQSGATTVSYIYGALLRSGQDLFAIGTVLILLATTSPIFAVFCLAMVCAQAALSFVQAKRLRNQRESFDKHRNALLATTDDILGKREIIAAYEQQGRYSAKIDDATRAYADTTLRLNIYERAFDGLSTLVTDYGRILVLGCAVLLAFYVGRDSLGSVGDAYFFASIYARLLGPAANLVSRYNSVREGQDTSRQFMRILEAQEPVPAAAPNAPRDWAARRDIEFREVGFCYPASSDRVLDGCSFRIPAGRTTLLLGPSGCGKSTVARILLGFWTHDRGEIAIGGRSLADFTSHELRLHMSYVAQGDHIVDDTIRDNLLWASLATTPEDEALAAALRRVHLAKPLESLARGLSLGEQQRLSVARMMLDESEIVIMDEPMAGVDVDTLRDVMPALRELLASREHTVLAISHRLSFAAFADHVVLMGPGGHILEQGDPRVLKDKAGPFGTLYRLAVDELALEPRS